ncbi:GerMN domain-containing protein [Alkaliphilus pronyensis]|uniref:GerMN domain-containing protein n=1 Tax=Alkaliphilus pronyensis TaxID=1482732 RepID=A0A6I0FBQ1_9FIRM|nr:GerMN domain-containing protein [Alkaliphilus pronyensis]KAB3539685.1 GerMN domain-containing protein [Alkaliphilus pronyensis]
MKKLIVILLVIAVAVAMIACSQPEEEVPDDNNGNGNETVDPDPQVETTEVTLYFMNKEYVMTGNEELEKTVKIEREVNVEDKPVEEVIMEELKKPDDEELYSALEDIEVISVEIDESIAYVNMSGEKLFGGTLEESSILTQVVMTLTELDEVDSVQFLVDGSKRETLMGHYSIEEPITREDISN